MKGYLHGLPKADEPRRILDTYNTPVYVTQALLEREQFTGSILEPANGDGHISRVFEANGLAVSKHDIQTGQDFLKFDGKFDNVVTNPPYGMVNAFIKQSTIVANLKVALMCRLHVVVSRGRYELLKNIPGVRIYIFTTPIMRSLSDGSWARGSAFTHCWLVLDKVNPGRSFEWIDFKQHSPCE
jgi:hypothetical protein